MHSASRRGWGGGGLSQPLSAEGLLGAWGRVGMGYGHLRAHLVSAQLLALICCSA